MKNKIELMLFVHINTCKTPTMPAHKRTYCAMTESDLEEHRELMRDYKAPSRFMNHQVDLRRPWQKNKDEQEMKARMHLTKLDSDLAEAGGVHWPELVQASEKREPVLPIVRPGDIKQDQMKVPVVKPLDAVHLAKQQLEKKATLRKTFNSRTNRERKMGWAKVV